MEHITDEQFLARLKEAVPDGSPVAVQHRVADHLCVSRPTLGRWLQGRALPHWAIRRGIFRGLDALQKPNP